MILFLRRIFAFVRPYKTRLILGLVCGILYGLTNGLLVVVIKPVVDVVFTGSTNIQQSWDHAPAMVRPWIDRLAGWTQNINAPSSKWTTLGLIGIIPMVVLVRVVLGYLSVYLVNWSALRVIADIRAKLFEHLQNLSLAFFSRAKTGDLISRITNDTQVLYNIVGNSLSSVIIAPVTIVALMVPQLVLQPRLTLVSMFVLPVCIVPITIYAKKVRRSARAMQIHLSELTGLMHESFTGNRIIKAYNLEETVVRQFRETTKKYVGQMMRVIRANEIPSQLMEFLGPVGVTLVFFYVLQMPSANRPTAGDFFAFLLSVVLIYPPIKSLTRLYNQMHQASAASSRVFELLDTRSNVLDPAQPVPLETRHADITFEKVDFDYGEKPVLRDISLTAKSGQVLALVGSSGSGKTTITNLLLRFYDPQRGSVRIGSVDVRQVAIKDLRSQIALVTQENVLFHDTIRRNIALGRPGATDAEIEAAARHAYAHEFIMQKPQGYETIVGEKGVALSGGQRQRIAIARAILKDAPILVLDEATSALDTESERAVQAALETLMQGRTTICIAHRLSTIQKADLIIVLHEGRIVERGTHAELTRHGGTYRRLYELQFQT